MATPAPTRAPRRRTATTASTRAHRARRGGDRRGRARSCSTCPPSWPTASPTRPASSAPSGSVDRRPAPPALLLDVVDARRRRRAPGHGEAGARRAGVELAARHARRRRRGRRHLPGRRVPASPTDAGRLVAFAAGSGITPVLSIVKAALATTDRPVRLLYANRDADVDDLPRRARRAGRTRTPTASRVVHHLDVDGGFVDADARRAALAERRRRRRLLHVRPGAVHGPRRGRAARPTASTPDRIHIERFTPAEPRRGRADADGGRRRRRRRGHHRARRQDRRPPSTTPAPRSCRPPASSGCRRRSRASRAAAPPAWPGSSRARSRCTSTTRSTDDEVAEGWILTCQSVPTVATVARPLRLRGAD